MPRTGTIDYSKWDNLDEYSDSDNDNEYNNNNNNNLARVTRLDGPSQVTFGGGTNKDSNESFVVNPTVTIQQQQSSKSSNKSNQTTTTTTTTTTTLGKVSKSTKQATKTAVNPDWIQNGSHVQIPCNNNNKDFQRNLYWCQDRYSVTLRLQLFFPQEKGTNLTIELKHVLPYSQRFVGVGSLTKPTITIQNKQTKQIILSDSFPHFIHYAQEDDDDEEEENDDAAAIKSWWTIERNDSDNNNNNEPYLCIVVYKAVPMEGMFIWWKRPFESLPENNNDDIYWDESNNRNNNANNSQAFLDAWNEAHEMFRQQKNDNRQHQI